MLNGEPLSEGQLGEAWHDKLRQSEVQRPLVEEIRAEAQRQLVSEEPELSESLFRMYGETGERLPYERVYFQKRRRLNSFALMSLIEPEEAPYLEALQAALWSICEERTWCLPAHLGGAEQQTPIDLFAAETGFALSEISVLLGSRLPEELHLRIREEVEKRLFQPFLTEGPYFWENAEHNWAAVCAGSIGAAALHLMDDRERLEAVLSRVLAAMDCFLDGYGEDGACAEGYSYWQYGFGFYVYIAQLLKAATDGAIDLFRSAKVQEIAMFQQKCFTGGRSIVNFSDAPSESGIFMGLSSYLHQEFPAVALPHASLRDSYTGDHCARWAPAVRNLLWWAESANATATATRTTAATNSESAEGRSDSESAAALWPTESFYLENVQWLLSRYVATDGATYSFAAKGGHNAEPHNHNDVGQFVMHADGEAYLADLGSGEYTADYFGPQRYTIWCNGSHGHSVPIIGSARQREGADARAVVVQAATSAELDVLELEMQAAYGEEAGLALLGRRFEWNKKGALPVLTIRNRYRFREEVVGGREIIERFVAWQMPEAGEAGGVVVLQGRKRLTIAFDAKQWRQVVTQRSDMDHFGRERQWYTLDFHHLEAGTAAVDSEFVFRFEP
ncbi:heparinase II/III family protein [Paenibacillus sp. Leaf72]|uniref:heparinase II/III family protein n=1 Tax=Paenibacillus sp. Leaf72 TaxID=1736234 RepID=UPI0006FD12B1|nr:heparinase II/III family protein [Paenibacillus sp. Leaf72]KQN96186.1 hypothetical protein ASF12_25560 [Paenibacillus sp. Leaf72]